VKGVALLVRVWLGSLFLYSAALKFARYEQARKSIRNYRVATHEVSDAIGTALPWVEAATGTALLVGKPYPLGPILGTALGTSFATASKVALNRGVDISCGCTGSDQDRVTKTTLLRAVMITAASLVTLSKEKDREAIIPRSLLFVVTASALVPAGLDIRRQMQVVQQCELQQREDDQVIMQLTHLLAVPPSMNTTDAAD